MSTEPKRLLDDPSTSEAVRKDLACALRSPVTDYDVSRGLATFVKATAMSTATVASTSVLSRALKWAIHAKWWLGGGVGIVSAVVATSVIVRHERAHNAASTVSTAPALVTAAPAPEGIPKPEPEAIDRADEIAPPAIRTPRHARHLSRPSDRSHAENNQTEENIAREVALLGRARVSLASDPAQALALTEQSQKEFPNGVLREEREAIAVMALVRLGRSDQAKERGRDFLARYPRGPFTERVKLALGQ